MHGLKRLLPVLFLGILSVPVIIGLSPDASLTGGIQLSLSADEIRAASVTVLQSQNIDPHPFKSEIRLRPESKLLRQIQTTFGLAEANRIIRDGFPAYRWTARWSEKPDIGISVNGGEEQLQEEQSWLRGDVRMEFDTDGRLLGFKRTIPDSLELPSIPQDDVLSVVVAFLRSQGSPLPAINGTDLLTYVQDSITVSRPQELVRRTDHIIEWSLHDAITGNPVALRFKVSGSFVSEFSIKQDIPPSFMDADTSTTGGLLEVVIFTVLFVMIIVISFRRFRAYEIGFRLALTIGIATGLGLGIKLYAMLAPSNDWKVIIPIIFGILFYGGGAIIAWAASESVVREAWREKLVSFDLLVQGYLTHSRIGSSIVRGICLGLGIHAVRLLALYAVGTIADVGQNISDDGIYDFVVSDVPPLAILIEAFTTQVFVVTIFLMFLVSWIMKRTGRPLISTAGVVMILVVAGVSQYDPLWTGILIIGLPFALVVGAFIRYDVMTVFLALIIAGVSEHAMILTASGHPFYETSAGFLGGMFILLVLSGLASQFRSDESVDLDAISPMYTRHITERERLRHELAIARNVQMSFLPKANPVITSLDIASRCAPALEVGGDYYDFIELPDGKLGVAVGDVSGKGTQAAFFMTLTKGFLRALARVSHAPGTVLNEVNMLFYENVERGTFISLIYGIFDTVRSRLTIARAGHNPVILRKSVKRDTQVLNPMGLALGLDKGDVFSQSVKEVSVEYEHGDVFVFYTDGISEAMNRTREEYGEQRLAASIEAHAQKPAAEILDGILHDMHTFVGKAEQHDDVTVVVVKVT